MPNPWVALVLLVLGVGIGWLARRLWLWLKHGAGWSLQMETPHFIVRGDDVAPDEVQRFIDKWEEAHQKQQAQASATGGWVRPVNSNDDSVPVLLSEGGHLCYRHGDHSGPTAMDEAEGEVQIRLSPGAVPSLPPSMDTPWNRELMERLNEQHAPPREQGDDRG